MLQYIDYNHKKSTLLFIGFHVRLTGKKREHRSHVGCGSADPLDPNPVVTDPPTEILPKVSSGELR